MSYAHGLGTTAQQDISIGGSLAATGATAGLILAGATSFIPIVGPIVAGITAILTLSGVGTGCGPSCIQATNCADQTAAAMQANRDAYVNNPNRTLEDQKKAEGTFQQLFEALKQCCGQVSGGAGKRCISERDHGGKYDDWANNYDPIVHTAPVVPVASSVISAVADSTQSFADSIGIPMPLLIGGGILLAVAAAS